MIYFNIVLINKYYLITQNLIGFFFLELVMNKY
jgi:hypothetical protein